MTGFIGLLFYSLVALAPIFAGVVFVSRFLLHRDRFIRFGFLAAVIGFLAGGVVGWASVPAQWTASFWTTVDAAGNSVKYGEPFEHMAERALMYFLYSALLGAIAFAMAALVLAWCAPASRVARRV